MRFSEGVLKIAIMLVGAIILFACTASELQRYERVNQVVDLGLFTFNAPSGDEWSADIEKESGVAQFIKQKRSFFGGGLPSTLIRVSYNAVLKEEMWKMTEEEIANDYRNGEKGNMVSLGVLQGEYQLEDVKEETTTVNAKKLYMLSYKQMGGRTFGEDKLAESILYLYFHPDFKNNHTFYLILISQFRKRNKPVPLDPSPAMDIIKSIHSK